MLLFRSKSLHSRTIQDMFLNTRRFREITHSMQYPVNMEVFQSKESLYHVSFDVGKS